jgi:hypothetical protein
VEMRQLAPLQNIRHSRQAFDGVASSDGDRIKSGSGLSRLENRSCAKTVIGESLPQRRRWRQPMNPFSTASVKGGNVMARLSPSQTPLTADRDSASQNSP